MTPEAFLEPAEIEKITGYKRPHEQCAELKRRGWRFERNAAGAPVVARAYMERRMVGEAATANPGPQARHNFGALRMVKG